MGSNVYVQELRGDGNEEIQRILAEEGLPPEYEWLVLAVDAGDVRWAARDLDDLLAAVGAHPTPDPWPWELLKEVCRAGLRFARQREQELEAWYASVVERVRRFAVALVAHVQRQWQLEFRAWRREYVDVLREPCEDFDRAWAQYQALQHGEQQLWLRAQPVHVESKALARDWEARCRPRPQRPKPVDCTLPDALAALGAIGNTLVMASETAAQAHVDDVDRIINASAPLVGLQKPAAGFFTRLEAANSDMRNAMQRFTQLHSHPRKPDQKSYVLFLEQWEKAMKDLGANLRLHTRPTFEHFTKVWLPELEKKTKAAEARLAETRRAAVGGGNTLEGTVIETKLRQHIAATEEACKAALAPREPTKEELAARWHSPKKRTQAPLSLVSQKALVAYRNDKANAERAIAQAAQAQAIAAVMAAL